MNICLLMFVSHHVIVIGGNSKYPLEMSKVVVGKEPQPHFRMICKTKNLELSIKCNEFHCRKVSKTVLLPQYVQH